MDRDELLDELEENRDLIQRAKYKLDDINKNLPIDSWDYIEMNLINAIESLRIVQSLYEKEIEKLGGNY